MALRIKPRFVIVYNDRSQSDLVHMGSSNRYDIDIHMVFVSYTTGLSKFIFLICTLCQVLFSHSNVRASTDAT